MDAIKELLLNQSLELLVLLLVYFFGGIRTFLMAKIDEWKADKTATDINTMQAVAITVVEAVEQIGKTRGWEGERKLVEAIRRLQKELNARGIDVTDQHAETLIESIVLEMNETSDMLLDALTAPE